MLNFQFVIQNKRGGGGRNKKRRNRILLVNPKVAKVNLACEPGEDNNKPSIPTTKGSQRVIRHHQQQQQKRKKMKNGQNFGGAKF